MWHYYLQTCHLPVDPLIAAKEVLEQKQKGLPGLKAPQRPFPPAGCGARSAPAVQMQSQGPAPPGDRKAYRREGPGGDAGARVVGSERLLGASPQLQPPSPSYVIEGGIQSVSPHSIY